jgi:hypothetical protein
MTFPDPKRKRIAAVLGILLCLAFASFRIMDIGDISWKGQASGYGAILAFLNCTKLPPSAPYLLMTLGAILLALSAADGIKSHARPLLVFGRVPLFFYLAHLYLIHALAIVITAARNQDFRWALPFTIWFPPPASSNFGFGLPVVYLVTVAVVFMLFPVCSSLNRLKQAGKYKWLSYL